MWFCKCTMWQFSAGAQERRSTSFIINKNLDIVEEIGRMRGRALSPGRWQCLCTVRCEAQMSLCPSHQDNSDSNEPGAPVLFPRSDHILPLILYYEAPSPIVSLLPPEFCSSETGGLEHSPLVWNTKLSVHLLTQGWTSNFFVAFKDIVITNITNLTIYCSFVNQNIKI